MIHVFAASYWSFVLDPAPAVVLGRLLRKRVVVNYHSGEAPEHLSRSRVAVPILRLADAVVVQSGFLAEAFARAGLAATVIPNHIEIGSLPFRARPAVRPLFLSTRALERSYDVATVLRAFAVVRQRFPTRTAGRRRREPSRGARGARSALGLDGITFAGTVAPARMRGCTTQPTCC